MSATSARLFIPAAQLIHGAVLFSQQRVVDAGLVLPDLDILQKPLLAPSVNTRDNLSVISCSYLRLFDDDFLLQNEFWVTGSSGS